MIYTVTFNPALDYVMELDKFCTGEINRSTGESVFAGGKGINVSLVLKELGMDSVAWGFVAGFSGQEIERRLLERGISCDFVKLEKGISRINVKLRHREETDVNTTGPHIDEKHLTMFFEKINNLTERDTVVIAGTLPKGLKSEIYVRMASALSKKSIRFIVDATGENLLKTLEFKPFLIKPNLEELSQLFDDFKEENLYDYMKILQNMGAENVLVSMGGNGSVLLDETGTFNKLDAIKGTVVNTVGAGDSMVAGFLAGYIKTNDLVYAHKLGAVSGSATAFSPWLADEKNILSLLEKNT